MESTLFLDADLEVLRRRCADLEQELETLRRSQRERLTIAADIHQSLLPTPVRDERIWVDVRYVPIEDVGGDYCQVRFPDRATCYITLCDIVGHGIHGFAEIAMGTRGCDLFGVADRMFREIQQYQHGPNTDDQTLIVAEVR